MVDCNALESNYWLLDWFKTQVVMTGNKKSIIISKMCQVFFFKNPFTYSDNILPTITKNNNVLELQGFLKHNDFASKSTNKFKIPMLVNLTRTNQ
jgi:hypothetical protein